MTTRTEPRPPPRAPMLFDEEHGATREAAALGVFLALVVSLRRHSEWRTSAGPVDIALLEEAREAAHYQISGAFEAALSVVVRRDGWIAAELLLPGGAVHRAWIERPYEEFEIWPDGAAGVLADPKVDDPPGRIGKQRNWMQLQSASWSGLGVFGHYFDAEEI